MSNRAIIVGEIEIAVPNKSGIIAEISKLVSAVGVHIIALRAYCIGNAGFIHFVTDDNKKALEVLAKTKYKLKEQKVVLVVLKNEIGTVNTITEQLSSQDIDIYAAYLTSGTGGDTTMVIQAKDPHGILDILNND